MPLAEAGVHFRYLGVQISPWKGITIGNMTEHLREFLRKAQLFALKPKQQLNLIMTYLIPQYIFRLISAVPSLNQLKEMDQVMRNTVKATYHLHPSATSALLHCSKKDGEWAYLHLRHLSQPSNCAPTQPEIALRSTVRPHKKI